jgi:hypothetical protein
MIKPLIIEEILVDISHNGVYQWTVNKFTLVDLRRQIALNKEEGYSIRINPQYWGLFDEEDDIENLNIIINMDGKVNDWFPCYSINHEYSDVNVFSEILTATVKLNMVGKYR